MEDTIVLYPAPGISHIIPLVELGQRILTHHPFYSITVIISHPPFEDVSTALIDTVSAANSSIHFLHLPPILPPPDASEDKPTLFYESARLYNPHLRQALLALSESSKFLKAFVMDFYCDAASEVTASLKIPTYYFLPGGANGLAVFLYSPTLHKHCTASLKDLDEFIQVPGSPPIPAYHMPALLLDRGRKIFQYFIDTAIQMAKSAGVIINTFEALEQRAIEAILDGRCTPGQSPPPLYCLGPLVNGSRDEIQSIKERHACLSWLDSQPSRSVVFLSFGSGGNFGVRQLEEIAIGLERSGVRFLWVVRAPPPDDPTQGTLEFESDESRLEQFLPDGFLERTKVRGMVVWSWAPQVAVLNHDSVGAFVTHCGMSSIQEAICAGVPMLAWPLAAEQKVNRAFLVEEIKMALSVGESRDGWVSAAELRERLTELIDSEHGKEIRDRVMRMRDHALATWKENGASLEALAKWVQSFNHI